VSIQEEIKNYFKGDELATSVFQNKYAKNEEETPDQMHRRMANAFGRIEEQYIIDENALGEDNKKYESDTFLSEYGKTRGNLTRASIYELFKDFKYIVPQGSVMSNLGVDKVTSLSNCFVIPSPSDSYGGILFSDEQLTQLMKRRGGVGVDISTLRPSGTNVKNAAKTSTGAISFMERFSNTTREVAQGGRRGALMLSIDINHPDVLDFIKIKRDLSRVTGANISIKLNDEFMKAVESDSDYILRFPCDLDLKGLELPTIEYNVLMNLNSYRLGNGFIKKIKAKEYWDELIKSAHGVAEPGLMYWDRMVNYSPDGVYPEFKQITTNPCSEIGMQAYDACRLIAVNLFSFVDNPFTDKAVFNYKKFYEINYEAMRLADDLVDLEIEHIDRILAKITADPEEWHIKQREFDLWTKIKETASASRRTGLGFTALGDTLAALNIGYDSEEGLEKIEAIMDVKLRSELNCTIDLSILRGSFIGWDVKKEFSFNGLDIGNPLNKIYTGKNDWYKFLLAKYPGQVFRMLKYGRRNLSFSTVAPTGTVSLMTQSTSGVEPLFMPYYTRRKKINPNDPTSRVDFTDQNGDKWQEYFVLHPKFKEWIEIKGYKLFDNWEELKIKGLLSGDYNFLFENSPWYGSTANDINWQQRVKIQSVIQKYITHSISSTVNLPNDVSEEEVSNIYMEAWKQGSKGITVYRDGSRSGVLVDSNSKTKDEFTTHNAPKRPKELKGIANTVKVKGVPYSVIVGLLDDKPYEIFCVTNSTYKGEGIIVKDNKSKYSFCIGDVCTSLTLNLSDEEAAISRLISTSLRHGADIKFIVEQLHKTKGDITSFTTAISRVLSRYAGKIEIKGLNCTECGSTNIIFEEGCNKCLDCGSSKCG
jgi:ribonucleoside-diphosphate reductase alpha chain